MEKLKLTPEQDYALKHLLESTSYAHDPGALISRHAAQSSKENVGWAGFYRPLDDLSVDQFCRAVYVGYEIIEPDQVVKVTEEGRKTLRSIRSNFDHDIYTTNGEAEAYRHGFDAALKILEIKI